MPELTAKQRHWSEQLKLADLFDGSMAEYANSKNIPVKNLYRWRNYFRKASPAKSKATSIFTQVVSSSASYSCLKLQLGNAHLEFTQLPNPQWLVQLIAQSNVP
ncbi:MAG: hypothetical protein COA78_35095 [Blastopirellula sp.]|nr:MAG: hypothetical protein COA78_35095 [Blastopirellula sp.]